MFNFGNSGKVMLKQLSSILHIPTSVEKGVRGLQEESPLIFS